MLRRIFFFALLLFGAREIVSGCTAFCAANRSLVLVGNNEDGDNPFTRVWFLPAGKGKLGRMYVGFDNLAPQGGMNERGLWFDAFAAAPLDVAHPPGKPAASLVILDEVMSRYATVEEVIRHYESHDRSFLRSAVLMYADASGDSVVIEPGAIVRKKGRYQVQTNFHQSLPKPEYQCDRFRIATGMLDRAGDDISVDLFRRILAAAHSEGKDATLYSNIYDLKHRVMYLYNFHNFESVVKFDLAAELKKGQRILEIPALFPETAAADAFRWNREKDMKRIVRAAIGLDTRLMAEYAGAYLVEPGLPIRVRQEGGRLIMEAEGFPKTELFAESPDRFFSKVMTERLRFVRDAAGRVDRIVLYVDDGREFTGKRQNTL